MLLTYVEMSLQALNQTLWAIMFGAVFLNNTFLAIDGFQEAKSINETSRR